MGRKKIYGCGVFFVKTWEVIELDWWSGKFLRKGSKLRD